MTFSDLFGGGGQNAAGAPAGGTSSGKGSSTAISGVGPINSTVGLDSHTLVLIVAVAGAVLLVTGFALISLLKK